MSLFSRKKNPVMQEINDTDILSESNKIVGHNNSHEFDLNIEKILENWEVYHALREIISNAFDEQVLTNTQDIRIVKIDDAWHIIDYGRGLNYHHLTQNENEEKLNDDRLIGRFGVGLKDALATLYRHGIYVRITSKYGIITLLESSKKGFDDIITLHAKIDESPDINMVGTDFLIRGCSDEDISKAKNLFLKFTESEVLETTGYGQIIDNYGKASNVYINGVKVAEEDNFLFSYNITSLTKQLKKALNRERTNVGRTAYSDRIKSILLACTEEKVIMKLVDDLQQYNSGLCHDELSWNDVAMYASKKIRDYKQNVVFITSNTAIESPSVIDDMRESGYEPVVVPETLVKKIDDYNQGTQEDSTPILTTNQYLSALSDRLSFDFVDELQLTPREREVFSKTDDILKIIGGKPGCVKAIKISETIYESEFLSETVGLWQPSEGNIIIKRKQLQSLKSYAGTLVHECMHASSGADDVSRDFEEALTDIIGVIVQNILIRNN